MTIAPTGPVGATPTGAAPPVPAPTTAAAPTSSGPGAKALIDQWFASIGLPQLGEWGWAKFQQGESLDQIAWEVRQTSEYKTRYPAMAELVARGDGITEAEYRSYENTISSLAQQWGLPRGMYDTPQAVAGLLLSNVSASEASSRIQLAAAAAYTAPAEVRDVLRNQFGGGTGDLVGMYLDGNKALPILTAQYNAAQLVGQGLAQGFGGVSTQAALRYGQNLSQTDPLAAQQQAQQAIGAVANQTGLTKGFGELATTDELLGTQFSDAKASRVVQRVQRGRLAQFAGSGSLAEASSGVVGLGSSRGT